MRNAPPTVPNHAIASAQVGCDVDVWDNELDLPRRGFVKVYDPREFPVYIIGLYPTPTEPARDVEMAQGPYTDDGRFRVVKLYARGDSVPYRAAARLPNLPAMLERMKTDQGAMADASSDTVRGHLNNALSILILPAQMGDTPKPEDLMRAVERIRHALTLLGGR